MQGDAEIKKLQRELISTNQMCQRLISSFDNQETELQVRQPLLSQVYSNELPTIVKCKLDNLKAPIKIQIDYSLVEDFSLLDLSIYYSFQTKQPNSLNCHNKFIDKPTYFLIHSTDLNGKKLKSFEQEFVYISFQSQIGCTLEITLKAVTLDNKRKTF